MTALVSPPPDYETAPLDELVRSVQFGDRLARQELARRALAGNKVARMWALHLRRESR